jgi:aspartate aminotransferase
LPVAQEPIAAALSEQTGLTFEPGDVAMTTGNFAGLSLTMRAVLDPGDELIFLSPPWFFYDMMIIAAGGKPVRVNIEPPDFDLPVDAIAAAITNRTRAIIVNTPHNPSGRMFSAADLERLAGVLKEASEKNGRPIYLISDEAYNRIVFTPNEHVSPVKFYPHSFYVYTFGKQLLTPGERIGYIALPAQMPDREAVQEAILAQQLAVGWAFPNATLQYSVPELQNMTIDLVKLQAKRDRMVAGLRNAGYELREPQATFYLLPKSPLKDDWEFTRRLAEEEVYILPGKVLELPGYFRLSVTASEEMIETALPVFERLFKETSGS